MNFSLPPMKGKDSLGQSKSSLFVFSVVTFSIVCNVLFIFSKNKKSAEGYMSDTSQLRMNVQFWPDL